MTRPMAFRTMTGSAVLLIGAPALMLVARLLLEPLGGDWGATLARMAGRQTAAAAGWTLATPATGLLALATAHVVSVVRPMQRALASIAAVLTAVGWAGAASISGAALVMTHFATDPDRGHVAASLKAFDGEARSGLIFLLCVVGALGFALMAVAIARSGTASTFAAVLVGLGGAGTLVTTAGPRKPLLMLATALLLAGFGLVARSSTASTETDQQQPAMAS